MRLVKGQIYNATFFVKSIHFEEKRIYVLKIYMKFLFYVFIIIADFSQLRGHLVVFRESLRNRNKIFKQKIETEIETNEVS